MLSSGHTANEQRQRAKKYFESVETDNYLQTRQK